MSWKRLLEAERVVRHKSSKKELDGLRAAVERNLKDAALEGLSADNRFGVAYEAALLIAKMAVHAAGYRVRAALGAHRTAFEALALVLGREHRDRADYFELCRRKRNDLSYEAAGVVTQREADEILAETRRLVGVVEDWIRKNHPRWARG